MAGFFSKERIEKRQKKLYDMGRIKFSLFYAILVTLSVKLFGLAIDIIFDGYVVLHQYITFKELLNFLILFILMFLPAYYLIWSQMEYDLKNKMNQNEK